jgi:hypothetical protein
MARTREAHQGESNHRRRSRPNGRATLCASLRLMSCEGLSVRARTEPGPGLLKPMVRRRRTEAVPWSRILPARAPSLSPCETAPR